ncbi:MAG TPA: ChbG/HpnK family deacetylase [Nitrospirales bacterium]|nr:ChbG/HpnK family deacetylase [Nitrospirales bacterium]
MKQLIVNADDFGQSPGVNRGVRMACDQGIVTSASLMVRWPGAREAVEDARRRPSISIGLHVDLGEWRCEDGEWRALYQRADLDDPAAVEAELAAQLARFRELTGCDPTHVDSHQHVHRRPRLEPVFRRCADALGVPLRQCSTAVSYCGAFYGQTAEGRPLPEAITVDALLVLLAALAPGTTELGCHPGDGTDLAFTMYRDERRQEVDVLCDPRVRAALERGGIALRSFAALGPCAEVVR